MPQSDSAKAPTETGDDEAATIAALLEKHSTQELEALASEAAQVYRETVRRLRESSRLLRKARDTAVAREKLAKLVSSLNATERDLLLQTIQADAPIESQAAVPVPGTP